MWKDITDIHICRKIDRGKSNVAFELIAKAVSFVHPLVPSECRPHIERVCCELNSCYWEQGRKRLSHTQKHILCLLLTRTHTFLIPLSLSLNILHTPTCMAHSQSFFLLYFSFTLSRAFSFLLTFRWCIILCPCVLRASCSDCVGGTKERWVLKQLSLVVRM